MGVLSTLKRLLMESIHYDAINRLKTFKNILNSGNFLATLKPDFGNRFELQNMLVLCCIFFVFFVSLYRTVYFLWLSSYILALLLAEEAEKARTELQTSRGDA
jgi:hypothetical protein